MVKRVAEVPLSDAERWDMMARQVAEADGAWVVVASQPAKRRGGRNDKIRAALERRGLHVEVVSRLGNLSPERPWDGWLTWARTR